MNEAETRAEDIDPALQTAGRCVGCVYTFARIRLLGIPALEAAP